MRCWCCPTSRTSCWRVRVRSRRSWIGPGGTKLKRISHAQAGADRGEQNPNQLGALGGERLAALRQSLAAALTAAYHLLRDPGAVPRTCSRLPSLSCGLDVLAFSRSDEVMRHGLSDQNTCLVVELYLRELDGVDLCRTFEF